MCDNNGEGWEDEEGGPGEDERGEDIEARASELGARRARYPEWTPFRSRFETANSSSDSVSETGVLDGRDLVRATNGFFPAGVSVRLAGVERGGKMANSSSEESSPPSSSRRIASALRNSRKSSTSEELVAGLSGASREIYGATRPSEEGNASGSSASSSSSSSSSSFPARTSTASLPGSVFIAGSSSLSAKSPKL